MARRSYQVGYGKPPVGTRFRKGQSGNPRGRPKGAKNFAGLLDSELDRKIQVSEGDRRRRVTHREAIVMRLVRDAIAGKASAQRMLLDHWQMLEERAAAAGTEGEAAALSASKQAALEAFRQKVLAELEGNDAPDGANNTNTTPAPARRRRRDWKINDD